MESPGKYKSERKEVAHFMRCLYKRGLTTKMSCKKRPLDKIRIMELERLFK